MIILTQFLTQGEKILLIIAFLESKLKMGKMHLSKTNLPIKAFL